MRNIVLAVALAAITGAATMAAAESAVKGEVYKTPQAVSTLAGTSATLTAKKAVIAPPKDYKAFPTEALKLPFDAIEYANKMWGRSLRRRDKQRTNDEPVKGQSYIPLEAKILSQIHDQGNPPPGETPEQIEKITRETDRKLQEMRRRSLQQEADMKANSAKDSF